MKDLEEGPEGVNGSWDWPFVALGKWDLGDWDWEWEKNVKTGMG